MKTESATAGHAPRAPNGRPAGARRWLLLAGLACGTAGVSASSVTDAVASAQISDKRLLPYPYDTVWPTAVRFLRVDRGYAVRDANEAAGYLLFEFPAGEGTGQGSLEAFKTTDPSGRPSVQVKVTTGAGPVYLPNSLLDGLAAKVRAERGQPAPPPPPQTPPPSETPPEAPPEDGGPPPELPPAREPGDDPAG